jgi:hypothetical protein
VIFANNSSFSSFYVVFYGNEAVVAASSVVVRLAGCVPNAKATFCAKKRPSNRSAKVQQGGDAAKSFLNRQRQNFI